VVAFILIALPTVWAPSTWRRYGRREGETGDRGCGYNVVKRSVKKTILGTLETDHLFKSYLIFLR